MSHISNAPKRDANSDKCLRLLAMSGLQLQVTLNIKLKAVCYNQLDINKEMAGSMVTMPLHILRP